MTAWFVVYGGQGKFETSNDVLLHANKLSPTLISRAIPAVDIPLSLLFVVKPVTYAPRVEKMLRSSDDYREVQ